MSVGQVIAKQIGNGALFMIGARQLCAIPDGLMFRIGRNGPGWNKVKIELNGLDLYDMTFYRIRKVKGVPEVRASKTVPGLYFDQLRAVIENETGLRASL